MCLYQCIGTQSVWMPSHSKVLDSLNYSNHGLPMTVCHHTIAVLGFEVLIAVNNEAKRTVFKQLLAIYSILFST